MLLLSLAAAVVAFVVVYVWGNAASWLGARVNPVDVKTAGLWFLRVLYSILLIGTVANGIGLVIATIRAGTDTQPE